MSYITALDNVKNPEITNPPSCRSHNIDKVYVNTLSSVVIHVYDIILDNTIMPAYSAYGCTNRKENKRDFWE